MTTISATMVADSITEEGIRICTIRTRYPRWIHAEGRTHRQLSIGEDEYPDRTPSPMEDRNLSRNAASSRAIPVKKMIEAIRADPAIPMFWGANQKGMQAGAEINEPVIIASPFKDAPGYRADREKAWLYGMEQMIDLAEAYDKAGYHKQIINRLLEPWMHIEVLFTATEWSNFYALRIHSAAEPHICLLATRMKEAMDASTSMLLKPGEWHLPYVRREERSQGIPVCQRLSVARCAHLSYETVGTGEPIDFAHANRIYDQLMGDVIHASPFEHQATPDRFVRSDLRGDGIGFEGGYWRSPKDHGNLVGWRQLRKMLPGECQ
jgi:hypothetical protein